MRLGKCRMGNPLKAFAISGRILAAKPDQLARNLAGKLMTYALGRKIGFSDRPAVEEIVRQTRSRTTASVRSCMPSFKAPHFKNHDKTSSQNNPSRLRRGISPALA